MLGCMKEKLAANSTQYHQQHCFFVCLFVGWVSTSTEPNKPFCHKAICHRNSELCLHCLIIGQRMPVSMLWMKCLHTEPCKLKKTKQMTIWRRKTKLKKFVSEISEHSCRGVSGVCGGTSGEHIYDHCNSTVQLTIEAANNKWPVDSGCWLWMTYLVICVNES